MRKSKFMKALLVFGMSVVTATAMVGITACNNDSGTGTGSGTGTEGTGGNGGSGHEHQYDTNWSVEGEYHWKEAVCCDDAEKGFYGKHTDTDDNNYCDDCGTEIAHKFATEWTKDASGHYKASECDHTTLKSEEGSHVDDDATPNVCDICGYVGETSQGYKDFVAANASATKVIDSTFFVSKKLPLWDKWGSVGLYASHENDTHKVDVAGGKATLVTPEASPATSLYIDWGDVSGKIVEGYMNIGDVKGSNSYTPLQFTSSNGSKDSELFGIRSKQGKDNYIGYRLNGGTAVNSENAEFDQTWANGGAIKYSYNTVTNTISVTVNGKALVTDLQLTGATLNGIRLSTGDSKSDNYSVDDIIVVTKEIDVSGYKAAINTNATNAKGNMLSGITVDTSAADTALSTDLEAATTNAECDAAYNSFYGKLVGAYAEGVVDKILADYPEESYTKVENQTNYEAAIDALTEDLAAAETLEAVSAAYTKANTALADVGDDDFWAKPTFTVTISGAKTGSLTNVKDETSVTQAMLDAEIGLTATQYAKYYSNSACTQELTLPTTFSTATEIYVKIGDKSSVKIDDLVNAGTFDNIKLVEDGNNKGKWEEAGTINLADNIVFTYSAAKVKVSGVDVSTGYTKGLNTGGKSTSSTLYIAVTVTKGCTIKAVANATKAATIAITPAAADISSDDKLTAAKAFATAKTSDPYSTPVTVSAHVDGPKAAEEGGDVPANVTYYICVDTAMNILEIVIEYDAD